jgi:hypothetical protein
MGLPQIPTEGLFFFTPNDSLLRSGWVQITAPDPEYTAAQAPNLLQLRASVLPNEAHCRQCGTGLLGSDPRASEGLCVSCGKPRRQRKAKAEPKVKWMMRWKVLAPSGGAPRSNIYGFFDGKIVAKGVCSSNGFDELMMDAAKGAAQSANGIFCIYGIVDWKGRTLHARSRQETIHHIDHDKDWPNYIKCPCAKCAERFKSC